MKEARDACLDAEGHVLRNALTLIQYITLGNKRHQAALRFLTGIDVLGLNLCVSK